MRTSRSLACREGGMIATGSTLIIQPGAQSIDGFVGESGLAHVDSEKHDSLIGEDLLHDEGCRCCIVCISLACRTQEEHPDNEAGRISPC